MKWLSRFIVLKKSASWILSLFTVIRNSSLELMIFLNHCINKIGDYKRQTFDNPNRWSVYRLIAWSKPACFYHSTPSLGFLIEKKPHFHMFGNKATNRETRIKWNYGCLRVLKQIVCKCFIKPGRKEWNGLTKLKQKIIQPHACRAILSHWSTVSGFERTSFARKIEFTFLSDFAEIRLANYKLLTQTE